MKAREHSELVHLAQMVAYSSCVIAFQDKIQLQSPALCLLFGFYAFMCIKAPYVDPGVLMARHAPWEE